ncbi:tetratricopeptide repeat protein [bacterium]|nr:tetratricopeptide repeat protein [bacterium]
MPKEERDKDQDINHNGEWDSFLKELDDTDLFKEDSLLKQDSKERRRDIKEDKFEEELFESPEKIIKEKTKERTIESIIDQELFSVEKEEIVSFEEEKGFEGLEEVKPEISVERIIKEKEITIPLKKRRRYLERALTKIKKIKEYKAIGQIICLAACIALAVFLSFQAINRYLQARAYLHKGITAIEERNFKKAEDYFKKSFKYSFNKIKVCHQFALSYAPIRPQTAIFILKAVLREKPEDLNLLNSLLVVYSNLGSIKEAEDIYHKILRIDSENVKAMAVLGRTYLNQGDIEKAFLECEKALNIKYDNVSSLFLLQSILMKKKLYNAATGVHRFIYKITEEKQCDPYILCQLGKIYFERNRKKLAEELFRVTVKHNPSCLEAHYYLGVLFHEKKILNRAAAEFQFVINKDHKHANAHNGLGQVYYEKNMMEKAFFEFNNCLRLDPSHKKAIYNLANVYFYYFDELKKCSQLYEDAYRLGINTVDLHYNLGVAYYDNKEYTKALTQWKKILPKEIDNPFINYNLGVVNLRLNELDEAKERFSRALVIFQKRLLKAYKKLTANEEREILNCISNVYNNQGIVYELMGRKREAMTSFAQSVEVAFQAKKKNKIAYDNLQRLFQGIPLTMAIFPVCLEDKISKEYIKKEVEKKPKYWEFKTTSDAFTYTVCFLIALFIFGSFKFLVRKKSVFDLVYQLSRKAERAI